MINKKRGIRSARMEYPDYDPSGFTVEIVPIYLIMGMVSHTVETALERYILKHPAKNHDKQALFNGASLLNSALYGIDLTRGRIREYNPSQRKVYNLIRESLNLQREIEDILLVKSKIVPIRKTIIDIFNQKQTNPKDVSSAEKFFHDLAEFCINYHPEEIERISLKIA